MEVFEDPPLVQSSLDTDHRRTSRAFENAVTVPFGEGGGAACFSVLFDRRGKTSCIVGVLVCMVNIGATWMESINHVKLAFTCRICWGM